MATLTFWGAARTVTGSKFLLELDGHRLFVDFGLFQGLKDLRLRNWAAFPLPPGSIESVILTHAHVDHSGLIPRLVAGGFKGRVYCTTGTLDLCRLLLPDAGHLQEEDAKFANRKRFSKHTPAMPLFTEADAHQAIDRFQPFGFHRAMPVAPGIEAEFIHAGHLLGSAFVHLRRANGRDGSVVFGGDLGRYGRPVLPDPSPAPVADVLVLESTYGDREHENHDSGRDIARIVTETAARGGKLIIPSFAIGRVEEVLYWLKKLEDERAIPVLPVYVDSPMALGALEYYRRHAAELDADSRPGRGDVCAFCTERFRPIASGRESARLTASKEPAIVISSSGMATGGRVLHHLEAALPDPANTVLFVGYQAAGTRGRALVDGAGQVKIHGQHVPVRAAIEQVDGMSAHADASEILRWLRTFPAAPKVTYLVHGEPPAQAALKARIEAELGWTVHVPEHGERAPLPL